MFKTNTIILNYPSIILELFNGLLQFVDVFYWIFSVKKLFKQNMYWCFCLLIKPVRPGGSTGWTSDPVNWSLVRVLKHCIGGSRFHPTHQNQCWWTPLSPILPHVEMMRQKWSLSLPLMSTPTIRTVWYVLSTCVKFGGWWYVPSSIPFILK